MSGTPDRAAAHRLPDLVVAGLVAALLSGVPSTLHALVTRRSLLATVRAAGTLVRRPTVLGGSLVHLAVSAWWTAVLGLVLPRRRALAWGAAAGLAIGGLDLAIADRAAPEIAQLPRGPQLADHVAFGALVGLVLGRRRGRA